MGIEQDFVENHQGSKRLYQRAAPVLPNGITHDSRYLRPFQVYVDRAAGSRKWDVDGHEYVDYVMGHGALLLGHNHPVVLDAAAAQLARGTHYGASHEPEVAWAEEVTRLVPSAEVVRFTSSGTEATLMALRLARTFTGRETIVKFDKHFHGWHDYVASNSKYDGGATPGIPGSTLESVLVLPPDLGVVREIIGGRKDIAGVIVEAAGASTGTVPLPRGFLRELRVLTQAAGVVMVMDEVVTGFRWSPGGVQEVEGIVPDITALAKILAGGFPGGCVAGRREIMDRLAFSADGGRTQKVGHPGTFNANPLSAAAGVACLREVGDGAHQDRATASAVALRAGMNAELNRRGIRGAVYGQSSEFRISLGGGRVPGAADIDSRDLAQAQIEAGIDAETQRLLHLAMLNEGVHLFGNGGFVSSVHDGDDIAQTLDAWSAALESMQRELVV